MSRLFLVICFSTILGNARSQVQQYVTFRIDSVVRATMEAKQIPGMQMVVSKFGLVLKKGKYGFANLETGTAVTDSTRFSVSAMSRAFTCAGILLLMEDGKLNIDDPVTKYFDSLPVAWAGITLRRLMNNTSGMRDDWRENDSFFLANNNDSAFFAALKKEPLKIQPGEGFYYGSGPFILGMIISKVSGESYADFMQQRIFDKLGMANTCINDPGKIIPNRAAGYNLKDKQLKNGRKISDAAAGRGDMGVLTTVTDMLKWYNALQDSSLLQKSSLTLMFTPDTLNDGHAVAYGYGWFLNPYRDHALISHSGSFRTGFNSVIEMYPEDHVVIIILCNRQGAGLHFLAKDIIGLFNPDYARASQMVKDPDQDSLRTMLHKQYFIDLGFGLDTCRKMLRKLHMPYYPVTREDLAPFKNISEFNFIRYISISKPTADIFGDKIKSICLYEVKHQDGNVRYYAFLLNESNKIVYIDYE